MTSKDLREIKGTVQKLMVDAETIVVMTNKGSLYCGTEPDIIYVLGKGINNLCNEGTINREMLKDTMKAATATEKELDSMIKEELEKIKDKIKKKEE